MTGRRPALVLRLLRHLLLLAGAAVMLAPFFLMVATSFKPKEEIFSAEFHLLPQRWGGTENYYTALTQVPLLHFLLNGVVVTAAIFMLQVLVNVPAAYALAKLRFRGKATLFGAVLLCLMIPYQAIALPIYILFYQLGLLNTYASLVLPFTISVFGIFLMRQFVLGVPDDLVRRDYLLTNTELLPAEQPMLDRFRALGGDPDVLRPVVAVAPAGIVSVVAPAEAVYALGQDTCTCLSPLRRRTRTSTLGRASKAMPV